MFTVLLETSWISSINGVNKNRRTLAEEKKLKNGVRTHNVSGDGD